MSPRNNRRNRHAADAGPVVAALSSRAGRYLQIATIASLIAAAIVTIASIASIFPLVDNFPKWDQWHLMPMWSAWYGGQDVRPFLFAPYNGHLNIVPRLIFFGAGIVTHWNVRFEVALSFLFTLGTLITVLLMVRETDRRLLFLAAPIAAQIFSLSQYENFHSGYAMGQTLSQFLATATVYLLTKRELAVRHVVWAAIAALLSTYSWGAGLATWGVGLLCLVVRPGWRRAAIVWTIVSAGIGLMVYRGAASIRREILIKPIVKTFIVLFGKLLPTTPFPSVHEALVGGFFLLIAFALVVALCFWLGLIDAVVRWTALGLLALGSGVLIALGRFTPGAELALVPHYVTATVPLLIALLVLATSALLRIAEATPPGIWKKAIAMTLVIATLGALVQPVLVSARMLKTLKVWVGINRRDMAKLIAGNATDAQIHESLHPNAPLVRTGVQILRKYRLSYFATDRPTGPLADAVKRYQISTTNKPAQSGPALPERAYSIRWSAVHVPEVIVAGGTVPVTVTLTNTSDVTWPVRTDPRNARYVVRLGYRWLKSGPPWNDYVATRRVDLPHPVEPGASVTVSFRADVPPIAGQFDLQVDALQEMVAWFQNEGAELLVIPVKVIPNPSTPSATSKDAR